jgi:hypothetical protein
MTSTKRLFAAFALVASAACGSTEPAFTPSGEWYGESPDVFGAMTTLALSLQVQGGQVSGTGTLDATPVTVSGTYRASEYSANLTLARPAGGPVTFEVTTIYSQVMFGSLRGAGYADVPMILERPR